MSERKDINLSWKERFLQIKDRKFYVMGMTKCWGLLKRWFKKKKKKDVVNKMLKIYSASFKCGFRYFYTYTYESIGKGFPLFLHADSYKV